jgi:hypothetical protein
VDPALDDHEGFLRQLVGQVAKVGGHVGRDVVVAALAGAGIDDERPGGVVAGNAARQVEHVGKQEVVVALETGGQRLDMGGDGRVVATEGEAHRLASGAPALMNSAMRGVEEEVVAVDERLRRLRRLRAAGPSPNRDTRALRRRRAPADRAARARGACSARADRAPAR